MNIFKDPSHILVQPLFGDPLSVIGIISAALMELPEPDDELHKLLVFLILHFWAKCEMSNRLKKWIEYTQFCWRYYQFWIDLLVHRCFFFSFSFWFQISMISDINIMLRVDMKKKKKNKAHRMHRWEFMLKMKEHSNGCTSESCFVLINLLDVMIPNYNYNFCPTVLKTVFAILIPNGY